MAFIKGMNIITEKSPKLMTFIACMNINSAGIRILMAFIKGMNIIISRIPHPNDVHQGHEHHFNKRAHI
jgi:hypothetical protein